MICPQCKCEYIRGVTQCSDCGVALVHQLEPEQPDPGDARLVAVWRGAEPTERDEVGKSLEDADIPYTFAESRSLIFPSRETTLEVWVADADQEKAGKIVADLENRLHPDDEVIGEKDEAFAPPESDEPQEEEVEQDDDAGPDSDLGQEWDEDEPATEVWAGDGEHLADTLILCLREVGIASRKLDANGRWSVSVRPPHEARAREIVRQVVDAAPPK